MCKTLKNELVATLYMIKYISLSMSYFKHIGNYGLLNLARKLHKWDLTFSLCVYIV